MHVEPVPCSRVSTDLFDPLYTCGILRPSGLVVKCLHEVHQDYDKLRQVTLSPHVCVVQKKKKSELRTRFLPPDVKGKRILCSWTWGQSRVSLLPLQTPLSGRRALSIRGLRWSLHKNHKEDIQRPDQVNQEPGFLRPQNSTLVKKNVSLFQCAERSGDKEDQCCLQSLQSVGLCKWLLLCPFVLCFCFFYIE